MTRLRLPANLKQKCEFQPLLEALTQVAMHIPMRHFRRPLTVYNKSDDTPVTMADRETEQAMRKLITEHYPHHAIRGEEYGHSGGDSQYQWVIDPIDGTKSFICGLPLFGSLIGLVKDKKPILGLLCMPALDEVFLGATYGDFHGCWKNGVPIQTSGQTSLEKTHLSLGEGQKFIASYAELPLKLAKQTAIFRFIHDCYAYALLSSGSLDAVVEFDLQPHDILPLIPIITASGGIISDWHGKTIGLTEKTTVIATSSHQLHRQLLQQLAPFTDSQPPTS